jgi:hypothetical protein
MQKILGGLVHPSARILNIRNGSTCQEVQHFARTTPAGGAHWQFNQVARQLNERSRETLGFET